MLAAWFLVRYIIILSDSPLSSYRTASVKNSHEPHFIYDLALNSFITAECNFTATESKNILSAGLKRREINCSVQWMSSNWTGIRFPNTEGIIIFAVAFRSHLSVRPACVTWVKEKKRPDSENTYSLLTSAEVKNGWSFTSVAPHDLTARYSSTGTT